MTLRRTTILVVFILCALGIAAVARQSKDTGDLDKVTTIDIVASKFQFDPGTVTVPEGARVRLRLRSADRSHSFAIKAFRVKTLIPKGGELVTAEFVADRAGTFDVTCAEYCGTGHSGMKGRLVVVPRER
jgi:heme/copper-type cytochrome/quinol oxidase subunit 2